jgi:hypothetical protein
MHREGGSRRCIEALPCARSPTNHPPNLPPPHPCQYHLCQCYLCQCHLCQYHLRKQPSPAILPTKEGEGMRLGGRRGLHAGGATRRHPRRATSTAGGVRWTVTWREIQRIYDGGWGPSAESDDSKTKQVKCCLGLQHCLHWLHLGAYFT